MPSGDGGVDRGVDVGLAEQRDRQVGEAQLAEAVGVSRQSINSIECGRYVPSLQLALLFARLFACSTDDIFTLETDR